MSNRRSKPPSRLVVGIHPVLELLRAGQSVNRIRVATTREATPAFDDLVRLADERRVPVEFVDRRDLEHAAAGLTHQGVVADAPPFAMAPFEAVVERVTGQPAALLVAIDGVTDPHNIGSIARTAEAVGAVAMLIPQRRSGGITPVVEKAAAGALAHLAVAHVPNLVRALSLLREVGVWSLGLDADADHEVAEHPLATEPCVVVVGAEGDGLSRLTRERCDALVRLDMSGQVASLNASVAAGIALYRLGQIRRRVSRDS
ncbi:MAG: 23S rRNA (guanosine(2251)-2'-O)-methyltransferase RlmB [Nitriliruptoraceae bacterium]